MSSIKVYTPIYRVFHESRNTHYLFLLETTGCSDGKKSEIQSDPCLPKEFPAVSTPHCPPPPSKDIYPTRNDVLPACKQPAKPPAPPSKPAGAEKVKKCDAETHLEPKMETKKPSLIERVIAAVSPPVISVQKDAGPNVISSTILCAAAKDTCDPPSSGEGSSATGSGDGGPPKSSGEGGQFKGKVRFSLYPLYSPNPTFI